MIDGNWTHDPKNCIHYLLSPMLLQHCIESFTKKYMLKTNRAGPVKHTQNQTLPKPDLVQSSKTHTRPKPYQLMTKFAPNRGG